MIPKWHIESSIAFAKTWESKDHLGDPLKSSDVELEQGAQRGPGASKVPRARGLQTLEERVKKGILDQPSSLLCGGCCPGSLAPVESIWAR
jgi:hypothetical protein